MVEDKCSSKGCISNLEPTHYNHGTGELVCQQCASRLNEIPSNKYEALINFGHDLCTPYDPKEDGGLAKRKAPKVGKKPLRILNQEIKEAEDAVVDGMFGSNEKSEKEDKVLVLTLPKINRYSVTIESGQYGNLYIEASTRRVTIFTLKPGENARKKDDGSFDDDWKKNDDGTMNKDSDGAFIVFDVDVNEYRKKGCPPYVFAGDWVSEFNRVLEGELKVGDKSEKGKLYV